MNLNCLDVSPVFVEDKVAIHYQHFFIGSFVFQQHEYCNVGLAQVGAVNLREVKADELLLNQIEPLHLVEDGLSILMGVPAGNVIKAVGFESRLEELDIVLVNFLKTDDVTVEEQDFPVESKLTPRFGDTCCQWKC